MRDLSSDIGLDLLRFKFIGRNTKTGRKRPVFA